VRELPCRGRILGGGKLLNPTQTEGISGAGGGNINRVEEVLIFFGARNLKLKKRGLTTIFLSLKDAITPLKEGWLKKLGKRQSQREWSFRQKEKRGFGRWDG